MFLTPPPGGIEPPVAKETAVGKLGRLPTPTKVLLARGELVAGGVQGQQKNMLPAAEHPLSPPGFFVLVPCKLPLFGVDFYLDPFWGGAGVDFCSS